MGFKTSATTNEKKIYEYQIQVTWTLLPYVWVPKPFVIYLYLGPKYKDEVVYISRLDETTV